MWNRALAPLITGTAKAFTRTQCQWIGCEPVNAQRIYFANHSSHLDFVLLWSMLPSALRERTRPVAAADYWFQGALKRFLIRSVFHGVPVERQVEKRGRLNPLQPLLDALDEGSSLILFPEGTRGCGEILRPFKSGIYHVAKARPQVDLVPVWVENCYRALPKGSLLPSPRACSVRFGAPARLGENEPKPEFLARLKGALESLRGPEKAIR